MKRALPKYDDTTVAMVMAGYPMPLAMDERREVIYRLRLKGMEINDIAAFLRVKPDLVRTDIDRYDVGYDGHPSSRDYDDKDHKDWIDGDYDRWTRDQESNQ